MFGHEETIRIIDPAIAHTCPFILATFSLVKIDFSFTSFKEIFFTIYEIAYRKSYSHSSYHAFHYEIGWKAAQSFCDLNELFGERTIGKRQCQKYFARMFQIWRYWLRRQSKKRQP